MVKHGKNPSEKNQTWRVTHPKIGLQRLSGVCSTQNGQSEKWVLSFFGDHSNIDFRRLPPESYSWKNEPRTIRGMLPQVRNHGCNPFGTIPKCQEVLYGCFGEVLEAPQKVGWSLLEWPRPTLIDFPLNLLFVWVNCLSAWVGSKPGIIFPMNLVDLGLHKGLGKRSNRSSQISHHITHII